ncbi:MAG: hypothetical protein ACKVX7_18580 [Planctomycetota bacterium]
MANVLVFLKESVPTHGAILDGSEDRLVKDPRGCRLEGLLQGAVFYFSDERLECHVLWAIEESRQEAGRKLVPRSREQQADRFDLSVEQSSFLIERKLHLPQVTKTAGPVIFG